MRSEMSAAAAVRISVVVVEEHELFRAGLCLLLSRQEGLRVAGETARWSDALSIVQRERPDVVLLGIGQDDDAKIGLMHDLFAASESTRILVLSKSSDQELLRHAVRLGAAGVLGKDKPADMLLKAIECVIGGGAWVDRGTTASLLRELSAKSRPAKQDPDEMKIATLSQREREVIQLVGKGLKNKQIAAALFISDITVHHHLTSIYSKLEVADRLEMVIYAYRHGLADIPR